MADAPAASVARVIHIRDYDPHDSLHVYIGRAGKSHDGYFGNPVRIGATCPECSKVHTDGGSTLACYEAWARRRMKVDPVFARRVAELDDRVLACFCSPAPCHGDVLIRLARDSNGPQSAPPVA